MAIFVIKEFMWLGKYNDGMWVSKESFLEIHIDGK